MQQMSSALPHYRLRLSAPMPPLRQRTILAITHRIDKRALDWAVALFLPNSHIHILGNTALIALHGRCDGD